MHFIPILSTLSRHRTAAALIVLEIAVTCAIVCNAVFVIRERLERMDRPSGLVEDELVRVQLAGIGKAADTDAITAQDLAALRAIPGVRSVAVTNMLPFGGSSWNNSVMTAPDAPSVNAAMYLGSADLLETFGVQLVAGRDFTPDEYVRLADVQAGTARIPSVIITRGLAERMFPGVADPVGKQLYTWGKREAQIVVGVIEHVARPNEFQGPAGARFAMMLPIEVSYATGASYVLRVDPARRAEVLAAADAALDGVDPRRILHERQTFEEMRGNYYKQDRAMAYLLGGVAIALLVITALGVIGLASFWVQQRTRQIGIRRALGATRGDILRYFQVENFILATLGIVLGMALAYAINLWLMDTYQVARLPAEMLPIGALLLWLLGQIAVLGPALRASMIPPAIATRTV
jgi:putative ABC transport system permease protein